MNAAMLAAGSVLVAAAVVFVVGVAALIMAAGDPWVGCPDAAADPIDAETALLCGRAR